MAKCIKCDGCTNTIETDSIYGNPPEGWLVLDSRGEPTRHYCSVPCMVVTLTNHLTETQKPYLVKT